MPQFPLLWNCLCDDSVTNTAQGPEVALLVWWEPVLTCLGFPTGKQREQDLASSSHGVCGSGESCGLVSFQKSKTVGLQGGWRSKVKLGP